MCSVTRLLLIEYIIIYRIIIIISDHIPAFTSSQTDYNSLAPRVKNVLLVLFLFFSLRSYVLHEFPMITAVNYWVVRRCLFPCGHCGPLSPFGPLSPCVPLFPRGPCGPCGPCGPMSPFDPLSPVSPFIPGSPFCPTFPGCPFFHVYLFSHVYLFLH